MTLVAITANVWARQLTVETNTVRQLLVPQDELEVQDGPEGLWVAGRGGRWPATRAIGTDKDGPLTAQLPVLRTGKVRVAWIGSRNPIDPSDVLASYVGAFAFRSHTEPHSLRRPQIGALHSVVGYWSSGLNDRGIVVMPTGTGKTETMIALLVACQINKLLVLVPTAALRHQVAGKFESLGILQERQIVEPSALRPRVGRLEHGIHDPANAEAFAAACNVLVATPHALNACSAEARDALLAQFTHLMVDEAHHAPAPSWAAVIQTFDDRPVLLFTATPFREDGKNLPGRTIFRFPLREAQRDNYFTHIDYQAVLSLTGTDSVIADLAVERLRQDLAAGFNHILMARARSVSRAKEIILLYQARAADLSPALLHDGVSIKQRRAVLQALEDRSCRVIVCVDMLGEGFDLPSLKVAALHDVKKSLSPMIQFIGRFTRAPDTPTIGTASVFVARDPSVALSPLRDLLREDADWNLLLTDITERASAAAEIVSEFEASFSGVPDDVAVALLEPKMSAIAYRALSSSWHPERALTFYGEGRILNDRVAVGASSSIAWFVVEHRTGVRWGSVRDLEQVIFELIILYFDESTRLLYIYSSQNAGDYADLARAVLGGEPGPLRGPRTFRVLAHLDRLIPTNIGLLDARDHFNRFTMYVGSDVMEALNTADRQGKSQTHIATSGFDQGERITISASLSGRFWSMRSAPNLKEWADWCNVQGTKLLDDGIDLEEVFNGLIVPVDLTERTPYVLLGLEWPWELFMGQGGGVTVTYNDASYPAADVGFEVDDYSTDGPFRFSLVTPAWRIKYQADFTQAGLTYSPMGADAEVLSHPAPVPLETWINKHKPTLFLEGDRMITGEDRLLQPRYDVEPFDRAHLTTLSWIGVDLGVESQGPERRQDSIQAFMSRHLQSTEVFDVLLDDDRSGEAADLVGLRILDNELIVTLVHCKYSSQPIPGARLADLYELCGQAIRGAKWRQHGAQPLLRHLDRRARRFANRTGVSPYEVGDIASLYRIRQLASQLRPRFRTLLVQPGLSKAGCTDEHLRLLAGAESYVHAVTRGTFEVFCSP
ncbi:DEAD/DEAH box helicase family protein [Dactylosporangium roseum]|uniref:DEAD/DEAH box helicase family protein n=1 Tax=Dactylosporangium roseum TaxID=47989 RepID=A0ABY5ZDL6_9ACTN|nr:DEAD/DEAH box helicase family protein [Dactylosporangium roseum]UWZ39769.1 DEAD/DEAH box helicase family protein [Dactylosporangium roseum]